MNPTLLDLYAAAALQGLIAHDGVHNEARARQAFDMARLMLAERADTQEPDLDHEGLPIEDDDVPF